MTRAAAFKQDDVTRAVRGVVKAGLQVRDVEIDAQGRIVVRCGESRAAGPDNPWDDEFEK